MTHLLIYACFALTALTIISGDPQFLTLYVWMKFVWIFYIFMELTLNLWMLDFSWDDDIQENYDFNQTRIQYTDTYTPTL